MKKIYISLVVVFTVLLNGLNAQCSLYPVALSSKVANSSLVIEGKVLAQHSFWNASQNYIYTSNLILVDKVLKGKLITERIEVITEGGEIGLRKQTVEPSLQLKPNEEGIFILNSFEQVPAQFGEQTFQAYADAQGFIKYDPFDDAAYEPFHKYNSINDDLYPELERTLGIELPNYTSSSNGKGYGQNSISSVTGISPLTITAGTSSIVTITGTGFGATQSTSYVEFYNADDGGSTFVRPDPTQYVSWSNTQIQVMVPTRAGTVAGTAGTGPVRVTVAGSPTLSAQTLTVNYGELNVYYGPTTTVYNTRHVDLNGSAGITWQMYTGFDANASAKASFLRSFQTWRCNTYINWILGATTTTNVIALDGVNIIRFDIGAELPVGVLGRCSSYFSGCITGTVVNWYVNELDICFDDGTTTSIAWQFGPTLATGLQYDFESVSLHELGHGHQLSHVINASDVMHYALSNSQNKRSLITNNINGGNDVMSRNTSPGVCGKGTMTALTPSICSVTAPTASFNIPASACVGETIALTDLSLDGPTSWSWTMTGGSPASSTLQNTSTSYSSAGIFSISLIATNGFGSSAILTKTINVVAIPTLIAASATICSGVSASITASGATNYTWNPGNLSGASQNLNPTSTTVYTINGSNGTCSSNITTTVFVNTTPTVTAANASICSGSSTLVTASGATNYTWNPGGLTGASQNLSPTSTTSYTLTGSSNSCVSNPMVFTITVNATPTLNVPNATICSGASTLVTASGASSYIWNPGNLSGASQNLSPASTQIYTVTGSTGSCSSTITTVVNVSASPTLTVPNATICSGTSTLITVSGATNYTWNPGNLSGAAQNLSPVANTVYTITGATGICTQSTTLNVSVTTTPTLSVPDASICSSTSTLLTASGANGYVWNPGGLAGASQNLNPGSTTVYTVVGTIGTCTSSSTATISVTSTPTISAANASICSGTSTLLTASGAGSYTWLPGNLNGASQNLNPNSTTVYTINGSIGTCSSNATFSINVTITPTISATGGSICVGNSIPLTASGASAYTWNPGSLTGASQTLSPPSTTIYTITGANGNCVSTKTTVITVKALPTLFAISNPAVICNGENSQLAAGGGVSYTWSPGNLSGSIVTVTPNASTIYTVTASDATCVTTTTVSLMVNQNPTITLSSNTATICTGNSATFTASGATNYSWSPGALSGATQSLNPFTTTVYSVVGSSNSCSSSPVIFTITVNPTPTLSVNNASICSGTSTVLSVTGAFSYFWLPGSQTSSTLNLNPLSTTIYTVMGFIGTCMSTANPTINVTTTPTVSVPNAGICSGTSTLLTASGATTYTWNPGNLVGASQNLNPSSNSVYTVSGSNGNCTSNTITFVNVTTTPTVSVTNGTICSGNSASLTASGASSYSWSPGSLVGASQSLSPTVTTVYSVTGSNGNCTHLKTATVVVNPLPTVFAIVTPTVICPFTTASLAVGGGISYTWTSPGPPSFTFVGSNPVVSPSVPGTYTVAASNGTCINTTTVFLQVNPSPTLVVNPSTSTICVGNSVTLSATGANNYTWMPGNLTSQNIVVTPTATSNYSLTGVNSFGCSTNTVYVLTANSNPTVFATATPSVICPGGTSSLSATGASTYSWNPGNLSGNLINVNPTSNTTYSFTGYNSFGCSASGIVNVSVNPAPSLTVVASSSAICSGTSVTLTVSGANTYSWSAPISSTASNVVVNPNTPTFYSVTGFNSSCSTTAGAIILVSPSPTITINGQPSVAICSGDSYTLNASGATNYTWMPGNLSGTNTVVSPLSTTIYTITGTGSNGCNGTTDITVNVIPTPTITVTPSQLSFCAGRPATLTASGANNYTWNPGNLTSTSINITPTSNTSYTLSGKNGTCASTSTIITITVVAVPQISLNSSSNILCLGDAVTFTASGANNYTYLPGNISINPATFSPTISTTYTVIGSSSNCTNSIEYSLSVSICESLSENTYEKLNIFPNPTKDAVQLNFGENFSGSITLYNAIGQLLLSDKVYQQPSAELNLEPYSKGVYFVKITSESKGEIFVKLVRD